MLNEFSYSPVSRLNKVRLTRALLTAIVFAVLASSCDAPHKNTEDYCIKEISERCNSSGGSRSIVIDKSNCLDEKSTVDRIMISIPYQELVNISDISSGIVHDGGDNSIPNAYEEYLLSLLPADPVETHAGSGIFYACNNVCRVVFEWKTYAVVSEWRENYLVNVDQILSSSKESLEEVGGFCVNS